MMAAVAAAWFPAHAQAKRTVGVLLPRDADAFWTVFRDAMHERGYVEGRDLSFELRSEGEKSFSDLAAELVHLNVALIVAHQTPAAQAARAATRQIPIVAAAGDLLATGLIKSLSHPGGNVTGVSGMTADVAGKCVELLREALPQASRLAVLANATDPFTAPFLDRVFSAAAAVRFELSKLTIGDPAELDSAFAQIRQHAIEAIVVQPSLPRRRAFEFGLAHGTATASPYVRAADEGALIAYGPDSIEQYRAAASVADKVLRGADPATLPVALPVKFRLVINAKTATQAGISIPATLLARADEVIE
jgi:putative ABC transport system substrate-binding protein